MNAYAERVIRTIQDECTDHFLFLGDRALRGVLACYVDWYHHHRPHQGIGNRIIDPGPEIGRTEGPLVMRTRLAGTLVHWERRAA
jgi:putative transposase